MSNWKFITGPAGTGKTWLVREQAEKDPGSVLCATTGIAAVNLGEGVVTINSLLKYFDLDSLRDLHITGRLGGNLRLLHSSGVRTIILDEVSMLSGEMLTILCQAFDEFNEREERIAVNEGRDPEPLGLTLTGDFCQLPPVEGKFAFEVPEWGRFEQNTVKLTEIRRQGEVDYVKALQAVRAGDPWKALEFFEPMLKDEIDEGYPGSMIFGKNLEVDRYNSLKMSGLGTPLVTYTATRTEKQRPEWKNIPDTLELRPGALVMVLNNLKERDPDTGRKLNAFRYVNGDLGVFKQKVSEASALVELRRTGEVVEVWTVERTNTVPLEPGRRKELKAKGEGWRLTCNQNCLEEFRGEPCENPRHEKVGTVTYMPLRAAWATSNHKSQGLTLDSVQLDFRGGFFKHPGMLYVGLSRARTAAGLRLVGKPRTFADRCRMDNRVKGWV